MEPQELVEPLPYHPIMILNITCIVAQISHQPHGRPMMYSTLDIHIVALLYHIVKSHLILKY
jgi:hypothetical protein